MEDDMETYGYTKDEKAGYYYKDNWSNGRYGGRSIIAIPCQHPNMRSSTYVDYCPDCGYEQGY